jgi:hypothetical protein
VVIRIHTVIQYINNNLLLGISTYTKQRKHYVTNERHRKDGYSLVCRVHKHMNASSNIETILTNTSFWRFIQQIEPYKKAWSVVFAGKAIFRTLGVFPAGKAVSGSMSGF